MVLLLLLPQGACWPPSAFTTGPCCRFASWRPAATCSRRGCCWDEGGQPAGEAGAVAAADGVRDESTCCWGDKVLVYCEEVGGLHIADLR